MRKDFWFKLNVFALCLIFSGCAGFTPGLRYPEIGRQESTVKEVQDGLEMSVAEFASPHKSQGAFNADIAPYGVLALLVRAENTGNQIYMVQRRNIKVFLGDKPLPSLPSEAAADQGAAREYFGKALFWAILPGPLNIFFALPGIAAFTASVAHTSGVNRRVQQHFVDMQFNDAFLRPNQMVAGFLYFALPDGVQKLEKLTIEAEASETQSGKAIYHKLSHPTVELSAPVVTRIFEGPSEEKKEVK